MPPKKQEEEASGPYLLWNILPFFCGAQGAIESLRKPVNIKKTLELSKIIEILKQKGIDKYIQDGQLNQEGNLFVSQNIQQAANEFIAQLRKPTDPKKDQKKDTKKDSKKQEVVIEEAQKPIQYSFQKSINQFLVFLDFPKDTKTLKKSIEKGWKIDVVVWVQEKVKESSRLPNYDLLNKQRSIDDFLNEMNSLNLKPKEQQIFKASKSQRQAKTALVSQLRRLRGEKVGELQHTIIIQIPYLRDLQHPENDGTQFLASFFKKLCELTVSRNKFEIWKKQQHVTDMVPTIKQKIRKEVVIEEKKEEKKGAKKQVNAQPQIEIVEEIIQKKYEDIPANITSNLQIFNAISKHRKKNQLNIYHTILDNLALSVSQQTEKTAQVQNVSIAKLGAELIQAQKNGPSNKITIKSISNRMPNIRNSRQSAYLRHYTKLCPSLSLENEVSLAALLKFSPFNRALEFEYKLQLFNRTIKTLETNLSYSFQDRVYAQKLDADTLNSRINVELDLEARIYEAECKADEFKILILARVNPPGRMFYQNFIFDWKVLPNFQFWQKNFKQNAQKGIQFFNYDWRNAGNLKILTKKLMPTDNLIITQSVFVIGDSQHKILSLQKDETLYQLKSIKEQIIFSKICSDLLFDAFTEPDQGATLLAIRRPQFTILFEQGPTIFWANHPLEQKRCFGSSGQVIKYLKNGFVSILYPNGNYSEYKYGEWKYIRNNKLIEGSQETEMKTVRRTDGDKKIVVREDETVFVDFVNGDQLIFFKDGTTFTHISSSNTIEISNEQSIIVRRTFPRTKDFNIIGTGSAFAFLGETNILERTFDGGLFQVHHPTFTWHSYTECVDIEGVTSNQSVKIVTFRDGSILKISHAGLLTFLHGTENQEQSNMHQRWLQLFTNPQYHGQGVYDVDLAKGSISTKDKESNIFKLSLSGDNEVRIAVSFNISSSQEQTNTFGSGYHVPQENYFLPPPQNHVTPRLFLIYKDGTGEQYLNEEQVSKLKGFTKNRVSVGSQSFVQMIKQNSQASDYYTNRFTKSISKDRFQVPSVLKEEPKHINLIPSRYNDIIFRNLQEIVWDRQFKELNTITQAVQQQRKKHLSQLQRLRKKTA